MTMQKLVGMSLLGLALSMPGCNFEDREPTRESYQHRGAYIDKSTLVVDENNDGIADVIHSMGEIQFIAEGHKTIYHTDSRTITMTPEMREAATKELLAERELRFLMDKAFYDKRNGGQK